MEMSTSITELATALAKAQGEIKNAAKSSDNPYYKSKYADLAEVLNVAREPLARNGLSIMQANEGVTNGYMSVTTLLLHSSGQYIKATGTFPVGKQDPQGAGSALTYARRYSLAAMLGIAQEDDDGNAACGKQGEPKINGKHQQDTGDKFVRITPHGDVMVVVSDGVDKNGNKLATYKSIRDIPLAELEKMLTFKQYELAHEAIKNLLTETMEQKSA